MDGEGRLFGDGDFDLLLPSQIVDENGMFLEETLASSPRQGGRDWAFGVDGLGNDNSVKRERRGDAADVSGLSEDGTQFGPPLSPRSVSSSKSNGTFADSTTKGSSGNAPKKQGSKSAPSEDEKKAKRRRQIAAASRASRARRKRELEDLREENKRLREERSQFLSKIGELQMKVENMRERGSTDMRVENELLRAQLEEHKRFVSCFKHLCDGAPTTLNARHIIYKQGSDTAQAHVLGLISQSQADNWLEATVPSEAEIPYQNFSMFYKFKADFGESNKFLGASLSSGIRQRLNVRVDVLFPGLEASVISDFLWNSFSNTANQQRLYSVKGIELTQLADDMPDKDTKMLYYREKWDAPKKDQDWVLICHRRRRELAKSTLQLPPKPGQVRKPPKQDVGKVAAIVIALSTTQHSVAPQFHNANRITSMFVQGGVVWPQGGDTRLTIVFSFPDDFKIKAIDGFSDILHPDGTLTLRFAEVLKEFNQMLGEHGSGESS